MLSVRAVCLAALAFAAGVPAQAPAERLLPRLPDAALATLECDDPAAWLLAAEHALGPLPATLPDGVRLRIAGGLLAVRAALRMAPSTALDVLAGKGLALGVVPAAGSPALVACLRPKDIDAATALLRRLPAVPWEQQNDVLLVASTAAGLQALRATTGTGAWSLLAPAPMQPAELRAHVDLARLRPLVPWLAPAMAARVDGGARFLFGAAVQALAHAAWATVSLHAEAPGFMLTATLGRPRPDAAPVPLPPAHGRERAVPTAPPGTLAVLALDRSLRAMLAEPDACFGHEAATVVRAFVSVADQVDGNISSFVDDVVGALREPVVLYVLPPTPPDDGPPPRLLLPGLCVTAPLQSNAGERHLLRTVSTLSLIANIERARVGKSLFMLRRVRDDDRHGLVAEPASWRGPGAPPLEQALTPCVLFGHGHVALATTAAAARAVLAQVGAGQCQPVTGDLLVVHGPALAAAWQANEGPLLLARRIDEGETPAAARAFSQTLQAVLRMFAVIAVRMHGDGATLVLSASTRRA